MAQIPNSYKNSGKPIVGSIEDREFWEKNRTGIRKLEDNGFSEEQAIKILRFESGVPELSDFNEKQDLKLQHNNKFGIVLINDTRTSKKYDLKAGKFSIYMGNGIEPYSDSNGNRVKFDSTDDDQPSVAAQFHVSSLSNIPINKYVLNGQTLYNRSAILGRADVVELKGNEMIILKAEGRGKNALGMNTASNRGVHIYAGDNTAPGASKSQPMVLGNNLQKTIDLIYEQIQSLSTNITNINTEIMLMKTALSIHFHPPFAPPSPTLAPQFVPEMLTKDLLRTINAYVDKINHIIEKTNRTLPVSKTYVLSRHNTVN